MKVPYKLFAPSGKVPYLGETPGELYNRLKSRGVPLSSFRAEHVSENPMEGMKFTITGPQLELTARVTKMYSRMALIGEIEIGDDAIKSQEVIEIIREFSIR